MDVHSYFRVVAVPGFAQEKSGDEFQEYVAEKMGNRLDDEQLQLIVPLVDRNHDGTISDAEFAYRMEIVQGVLSRDLSSCDTKPADDKPDRPVRQAPNLVPSELNQAAVATV